MTRQRKLIIWCAVSAVVLAAAVAVFLLTKPDQAAGQATPAGEELPAPTKEDARSTWSFLEGTGARLLVVHRVAAGLATNIETGNCVRVAEQLDREAPAGEVGPLLGAVGDESLQALLTHEHDSLAVTLAACAEGKKPTDERVLPLAEITRSVQARLDELKAAR